MPTFLGYGAASVAGVGVAAATPGPTPDFGLTGACNMTNPNAQFGMFTVAGSHANPNRFDVGMIDSERAAMIYQHKARGADKAITDAIDAHVRGEQDQGDEDDEAGVLVPGG